MEAPRGSTLSICGSQCLVKNFWGADRLSSFADENLHLQGTKVSFEWSYGKLQVTIRFRCNCLDWPLSLALALYQVT